METITAYELRKNLNTYIKRASSGQPVRVTYRGHDVVVLGPEIRSAQSNAAAFFNASARLSSKLGPEASRLSDAAVEELLSHRL